MNEVVNELVALVGGASSRKTLSRKGTSRHNRKSIQHDLSPSNHAFHLIADKTGLNCWEAKKCGRVHGGQKVKEFGVCPAYPNDGRSCWDVAGTFCGGQVQGSAAQKRGGCLTCDFYKDHRRDQTNPRAVAAHAIPLEGDDDFTEFNG